MPYQAKPKNDHQTIPRSPTALHESGATIIGQIAQKTSFWDRSKHRAYEIARETAVKIIDDPKAIKNARAFIRRNWATDPSKAKIFPIWIAIPHLDPCQ